MPRQIGRARQHPARGMAQRPCMQAGIGQRADADGQIDAPLQQIDDAVVAMQLQLDQRIARAEIADQRDDHMQHERRRGIDPQAPGRRLPPQRHLLLGFLDAGQNPPRLRQERLAFLGQLEAPRGAAQQRHRQLVLQPTQRPAYARGGLFQLLGRSADRATVDHADKGEHFVEVGFHGWESHRRAEPTSLAAAPRGGNRAGAGPRRRARRSAAGEGCHGLKRPFRSAPAHSPRPASTGCRRRHR